MKQSVLLSSFYRAWLAWLDAGAEEHPAFDRNSGLCLQLSHYLRKHFPEIKQRVHDEVYEMEAQFRQAGLCHVVPFNGDDQPAYINECFSKTCHLNPDRVQWVRDHV